MHGFLKIAGLAASAALLCGFDDQRLEYKLSAFRGAPISAGSGYDARRLATQSPMP
jgi:hypothetical protein